MCLSTPSARHSIPTIHRPPPHSRIAASLPPLQDLEEQLEVAVAELGRSQEALEQARGSAAELGSEKRRLEEALEERAVREREMEVSGTASSWDPQAGDKR